MELVHPMWHVANFTTKWIYGMMIFSWLFGLSFNLPYAVPTSKVNNKGFHVGDARVKKLTPASKRSIGHHVEF